MHWIGAKFCVCRSLEPRDKSLNLLHYCRKTKEQRKNKERVLVAGSASNLQKLCFLDKIVSMKQVSKIDKMVNELM